MIKNLHPRIARQAVDLERDRTRCHVDGELVCAGSGLESLRVAPDGDLESTSFLEQRDDEDFILQGLISVGPALEVVAGGVVGVAHGSICSIAVDARQRRSKPVNNLVFGNMRCRIVGALFIRGDEGLSHVQPAVVRHAVRPLGVSVVAVRAVEAADVVRLAVVVPGDDFDEARLELQDLRPAVEPEEVSGEHPVLGVRHFGAKVCREPGGYRGEIWLSGEGVGVSVITILNSNIRSRLGGFVIAVAGPGHPVKGTVNITQVRSLLRMKVWRPKDVSPSRRTNSIRINTITREARSEDLAVDEQLSWLGAVLLDHLADLRALVGVVPVEVEADEDLHAVVGRGLVGVLELLVGVRVYADVERKGVDAGGFGILHVGVEVGGAASVADDANLVIEC